LPGSACCHTAPRLNTVRFVETTGSSTNASDRKRSPEHCQPTPCKPAYCLRDLMQAARL
jgi:hypothetical protein